MPNYPKAETEYALFTPDVVARKIMSFQAIEAAKSGNEGATSEFSQVNLRLKNAVTNKFTQKAIEEVVEALALTADNQNRYWFGPIAVIFCLVQKDLIELTLAKGIEIPKTLVNSSHKDQ